MEHKIWKRKMKINSYLSNANRERGKGAKRKKEGRCYMPALDN
jgi:hypothetical protein